MQGPEFPPTASSHVASSGRSNYFLSSNPTFEARGNLSPVPRVQKTHWSKPILNYVKFNLDGYWSPGTRKGSIDIMSRNSSGEWCGGLASPLLCDSSLSAEAASALCALHLAKNRGCLRVIMETDCKVLIDCIFGFRVITPEPSFLLLTKFTLWFQASKR
ncbi:unnamed protein product [Prunus armeniaca]|uniref:RNase H type-1 domain-containing protein n=1 Tax=Prunus armeniaca TaxID=36596 RepID=A0A6J5V702_PRUAR|nr:unnamed protein product [Prunus armeniaca]